jgi:hypothetical protein
MIRTQTMHCTGCSAKCETARRTYRHGHSYMETDDALQYCPALMRGHPAGESERHQTLQRDRWRPLLYTKQYQLRVKTSLYYTLNCLQISDKC